MTCTIIAWNIAWRRLQSAAGREMRDRIFSLAPNVVCITEGHTDFLPDQGHVITSEANYGYRIKEGRRKVQLWSREPWREIDQVGHPSLPGGRFVSGRTATPLGSIRFLGVCIPWSHAHVTTGRRDRHPWEDHLSFFVGLTEVLRFYRRQERMVVVGDYNQTVPRTRAPKKAHEALLKMVGSDLVLATRGLFPEVDKLAIDHVAHTKGLRAVSAQAISNVAADGSRLSDHFGVRIDLTVGDP